jgi:hypothetical protein
MKKSGRINKFPTIKVARANGRERVTCPECGSVAFFVDYGDLSNPKAGKRKVGLFATCVLCGFSDRLTSGGTQ